MRLNGDPERGGWLAAATFIATLSGLWGALFLMWGQFAYGGGLVLVSVAVLRWPRSFWVASATEELSRQQRTRALLAVCGVAVFFRAYQVEPPGIWGDDAINGLLALDVLDGKITSPFQLVAHAMSVFHALTSYTIAGAFWLFGAGPVALRLPGLVVGVLSIPLLYGIVSPLFGFRVALVAALFFASSPLQLNHDKVLIQVVLGQFFLMLGMCALVRGIIGTRRWLIPLAGAPLALCLYTYHSAKIAPLVAGVFALVTMWKAHAPRRTLLWEFAGLLVVFVACSIPAADAYIRHPDALTGRASSVALWPAVRGSGSLRPLWNAVWRTLMIFQYQQGPVYHWVGIGWDPALGLVLAFLVAHGMVESLGNWTEPRHALLLGWVIVGLIPGFLSTEAPRVYRVLLASPPLYVWAALPVVRLYTNAAHAAPRWRWVKALVALVVLSVPAIDFNYYFYRVYTSREFRWFQAARLVEMARTLKALGPGWKGYVCADSFAAGYETLAFLSRAWGLKFEDVSSLADVLPVHEEPSGGALFIVDRSDPPVGALIQSLYPTLEPDVRTDPPVRTWWFDRWMPLVPVHEPAPPTVTFFAVSRRTAESIRGITATFLAADGAPITTRVASRLRIEGMDDVPRKPIPAAQVKWSGAVYAPRDGIYKFRLESAGEARVWIDGQPVVSHAGRQAAAPLAQGLHRITAEATLTDTPTFRLQWQPPSDEPSEIPPALLFRNSNVHGLLAEYDIGGRLLHRVEPFPYYAFFGETFSEPFDVTWRGRLRVPQPGGYRIDVTSNGQRTVTIDGQPLRAGTALAAGEHDLTMQITGARGAARLQFLWQPEDKSRESIPPDAFTPPDATPSAPDGDAAS